MRIKLSELRKIVREEKDRLDSLHSLKEARPQGAIARQEDPRRVKRKFSAKWEDDEDSDSLDSAMEVPEPVAYKKSQGIATKSTKDALSVVQSDLKKFNPPWHRWVCRTAQGKELSELTIELEKALAKMSEDLTESLSLLDLQNMIKEEAKKIGIDEVTPFGGVAKVAGGRGRQPRGIRRGADWESGWEKAPVSRTLPKRVPKPSIANAKKIISDWLFLYDSFSPKFRRSMCMGKAGESLAFALNILQDELESVW